MRMRPSARCSPMSPVRSQPSTVKGARRRVRQLVIPTHHIPAPDLDFTLRRTGRDDGAGIRVRQPHLHAWMGQHEAVATQFEGVAGR